MSAYVCDTQIFVEIARAARELSGASVAFANADAVCEVLALTNVLAVAHRYNEAPEHVSFAFGEGCVAPPQALIKMCHEYAYQACEIPSWEVSLAKKVVDAVEAQALASVANDKQSTKDFLRKFYR